MLTDHRSYQLYFKHIKLPIIQRRQFKLVRHIQKEGKATIAFIVSSITMWRCQFILKELLKDQRFSVYVVLYPYNIFSDEDKQRCIIQLKDYFCFLDNTHCLDLTGMSHPGLFLKETINPDIIFYPQPYYSLFGNDLDSSQFEDKLLCYVPYSLNTIDEPWVFNQRLNNVAWRLYYSTVEDFECGQKVTYNKGKNIRIVGNALADSFLASNSQDFIWKPQTKPKKKVIWAPHYSITEGGLLNRNAFLSVCHEMLQIATEYQESIQFAFKPHPRLKSELYKHPDWGKEKTDHYYQTWINGTNTQLETGSYIDLFMSSDAMMHDCASFTAEYLYTRNPVLFLTGDKERIKRALNRLGKAAFDSHYHGCSPNEIRHFLDQVVLGHNDPKESERNAFFRQYLLPPNGARTADNIYRDITSSLSFK